eukprot:TRINITY_DN35896_c0_g1_i1.p2 TRINITY_DN35896_c0_g1~~TRINITY_DN35896_c0_g1_i1.p2  ORF type:complete len:112 (+),score=11.80 TRINITY_DN35896_c0_g1_i1:92-427(+)
MIDRSRCAARYSANSGVYKRRQLVQFDLLTRPDPKLPNCALHTLGGSMSHRLAATVAAAVLSFAGSAAAQEAASNNTETASNTGADNTADLEIGRAVQQECRDRSRMPSSA